MAEQCPKCRGPQWTVYDYQKHNYVCERCRTEWRHLGKRTIATMKSLGVLRKTFNDKGHALVVDDNVNYAQVAAEEDAWYERHR